ncbi:tetratricopeptide repeat protein [Microbispora sp. ZYX-F-249]|uniref:Tetratricopeptide repeat protein n=1 Tax=Microbispora maris TaxID=3144104 RepID=A0ABV0B1M7_9ACTN
MAEQELSRGRWRTVSVWARRHLTGWIITATAVNAALLTLTTMLMQLPGQRDSVISIAILVVLVCAALSIALPILGHGLEVRHRTAEERQARIQHLNTLLAVGSAERLPRLADLTVEQFGATPTRYTRTGQDPYVPRSPDDEQLRATLRADGPPFPFVLVWGPTKAGKTRLLAEALHAALPPDTHVVIPVNGPALADLAHRGLPFAPGVPALVYLDDLTVADLEALTTSVLEAVTSRAVLATTMTAKRRSQILSSTADITRTAHAALARTHHDGQGHELVFRAPTAKERVEAERLYPGETFRGSIAETLVGGAELIAKYRAGQDTNPAGYALVQAAIDCRRAGWNRPVTDAELRRLFGLYLPQVRAGMPATTAAYQAGLHEWAAVPIASQVALLNPALPTPRRVGTAAEAGWVVLDHVVSADDGALDGYAARPIPDDLWIELIDLGGPSDADAITYAALNRGQLHHAVAAARKAATSADPDEAASAAFNLGVLLAEQGDVEGARAAYQDAIDSGHPDHAPKSAVNTGVLLKQQGDVDGARAAYQRAIDSGHPDYAPAAAVNLGNLLKQQGDVDGARAAYQRAINSGNPDQAPIAAFNLGVLLAEQGDVEAARAAYQHAIDSGHPDHAPAAAVNLGNLLKQQGDVDGARAAYQRAINSGNPDQAPKAAVNLGNLLKQQGDVEGARAAYQRVIDSGHPDHAPMAAINLGVLLEEQGVEAARTAYQDAIDSGHPDHAPMAAINLGVLLAEQGDVEGARAAYQDAIDSGHPDHAPMAAINLGVLLEEQGVEAARTAYQDAIDSGHPDHAPAAAFNLGLMLAEQGDVEGARAAYQDAIDSGHPDHAPMAAVNLGVLLKQQGDMEGARAAYQRVIDSGHPDQAPKAAVNLGVLLKQQGEVEAARTAYQHAIDSGHDLAAAHARQAIEDLHDPGETQSASGGDVLGTEHGGWPE